MTVARKYRLKKGDTVAVLAGKDKGKRGKVLQVLCDRDRILVEKVNMVKRHMKQNPQGGGGIIEKETAIHMSNVGYLCTKCDTHVRIRRKFLDDGRKVRVCGKCGEVLDK